MKVFNGLYLKECRERQGLSQLELAQKVNEKYGKAIIDVTSISRWERNPNAAPRNNNLVKVAETLGVSADVFYEVDDNTAKLPSNKLIIDKPMPLQVKFPLRSDFSIDFTIPSDLTEKEAERFSNFVKTLFIQED